MGVEVRESVLQRARRSCQAAVESAGEGAEARVSAAGAAALAARLAPPAVHAACAFGLRLPVRFDSQEAEVTAMALLSLLDFGSGYDPLLLAQPGGRRAGELAQYGLLGLLLRGARLDSPHFLAEFSDYQTFEIFGVDAAEEEPVPGLPGVTLTRPGPLTGYTSKLRTALNDAGRALLAAGVPSLGALILRALDAQQRGGGPPSAAALVEELADAIPGFADALTYGGREVLLLRKAQALAVQLHLRFRGADPLFRFADMADLMLDTGAVMAAVLAKEGVLCLSGSLAAAVAAGDDLQGEEGEALLRAATFLAGDAVCTAAAAAGGWQGAAAEAPAAAAAAGELTTAEPAAEGGAEGNTEGSTEGSTALQPWQLSLYLLLRARKEEWAGLQPHIARGTLAY